MMWPLLLVFFVVSQGVHCFHTYLLSRDTRAILVRVVELENQRTIDEEARREIQRLSMEALKERKLNRCQKRQNRQSL